MAPNVCAGGLSLSMTIPDCFPPCCDCTALCRPCQRPLSSRVAQQEPGDFAEGSLSAQGKGERQVRHSPQLAAAGTPGAVRHKEQHISAFGGNLLMAAAGNPGPEGSAVAPLRSSRHSKPLDFPRVILAYTTTVATPRSESDSPDPPYATRALAPCDNRFGHRFRPFPWFSFVLT